MVANPRVGVLKVLGSDPLSGGIGQTLSPRPAARVDARVDMTAMIDLVFMLNIFFLVTTLVSAMAEIDLPAAQHVVAADLETSTVFTVIASGGNSALVYAGENEKAPLIPDDGFDEAVENAINAGVAAGKMNVVIKAEKGVPLRAIARIAAAASMDNVKLHLAVMEKDA